jgi:L-fuculose-phosphate aldolase
MTMTETELREQICHIGRLLYRNNLIDSASGNISTRLAPERILCTPSGLAKGFMRPEQLIVVNMAGERVDTPNADNIDLRPTSELLMHLECYRQRDDVQGVVHAHPPNAVALTLTGHGFSECVIPEAIVLLGVIPVTPYATPSGPENRDAISRLVREHDAIMLAYHGSLTVAETLWDAYLLLETLEHTAKIMATARSIGPIQPLPASQVRKLFALRQMMGRARPGDGARFEAAWGLGAAASEALNTASDGA